MQTPKAKAFSDAYRALQTLGLQLHGQSHKDLMQIIFDFEVLATVEQTLEAEIQAEKGLKPGYATTS